MRYALLFLLVPTLVYAQDVDIQVQNGTLTLKGERKFESDVKEDNFRRIERVYGSFARSFALPQTVDAESVAAEYRNGVLEIMEGFMWNDHIVWGATGRMLRNFLNVTEG